MYLRYYLDAQGKRVYTFKFHNPEDAPTMSAHPAKFSPDDPYQRERMKCKERFNLLPTQKPALVL